jgi:ABC-2 type transport system ATP-binding protein
MIELIQATRYFGRMAAVNELSLNVGRGEVLGLLGPNGAGKTTTMRMVTGYLSPSAGIIRVGGFDIEEQPIEARALIGYLPENAPMWPDMTVEACLRFIGGLRGLRKAGLEAAVTRSLGMCKLESVRQVPVDTLSKGFRHRVCLAQAILADPPVLVLDEPTDGLDPNQKQDMRQLIREMGRDKAILVSTHILDEVEAICSRVAVIAAGRLAFAGTPAEMQALSPDAGTILVRFDGAGETVETRLRRLTPVRSADAVPGGGWRLRLHDKADLPGLLRAFAEAGLQPHDLRTDPGRLDTVFHQLTIGGTEART